MRVIVPDTSVMVAAFVAEKLQIGGGEFDLSLRARPIARAIRLRQVHALAPDLLISEFVATLTRTLVGRGEHANDADTLRAQAIEFLSLPIRRVPAEAIAATALDLIISEHISPPDSWFVAAAIHHGAELWYTHRHKDGIVELAEKMHPGNIFTLTEKRFALD